MAKENQNSNPNKQQNGMFQELFNYLSNELDVTPTITQMHEIVKVVKNMIVK